MKSLVRGMGVQKYFSSAVFTIRSSTRLPGGRDDHLIAVGSPGGQSRKVLVEVGDFDERRSSTAIWNGEAGKDFSTSRRSIAVTRVFSGTFAEQQVERDVGFDHRRGIQDDAEQVLGVGSVVRSNEPETLRCGREHVGPPL